MTSLSAYLHHIRACATIRALLRENPSPNLQHLYWYDMPLRLAVSWRGIVRVMLWGLLRKNTDSVSASYGLNSFYYADTTGVLDTEHAASVWNCLSLDSQPVYPATDEVATLLRDNASVIRAEFHAVAKKLATHPDSADFASRGRWTGLFLSGTRGKMDTELARECPQTARLMAQLPVCSNFGFVAFSGMEPGSRIRAHVGSSNLRLRYHLGIDIPEPQAGKIRVDDQWLYWEQDQVIAFDDSYEHEVIYDGTQDRIVLIVDVWHPGLSASDIEVLSHPVFGSFGK